MRLQATPDDLQLASQIPRSLPPLLRVFFETRLDRLFERRR